MPSASPGGQLALDLGPPPPPDLDNFVAGPNAECVARLKALAAGDRGQRFLYLWGPQGSGRSHLASALASALAASATPTALLGPASPLAAFVDGLQARGAATVLDDAHRLDAPRQEAAFHRYVAAQQDAAAVFVATGDAPPRALPVREDLRTRLGGALVLQLSPLTDADKRAALAQAARARGVTVSPEVFDYMLLHLPRDLRALMAALDALDRFALEQKRAITMPLLREFSQRGLPLDRAE